MLPRRRRLLRLVWGVWRPIAGCFSVAATTSAASHTWALPLHSRRRKDWEKGQQHEEETLKNPTEMGEVDRRRTADHQPNCRGFTHFLSLILNAETHWEVCWAEKVLPNLFREEKRYSVKRLYGHVKIYYAHKLRHILSSFFTRFIPKIYWALAKLGRLYSHC
jgi:hypothetical protein